MTAPGAPSRDRSLRQVVADLSSAQKSGKGAPAYSRFVNRKLGRYLAAFGYKVGLTPNGVTTISAMFSLAAILLLALARPSWTVGVLVALGLVLGYAFDSADGQLARLLGGGSLAGEWLDHMVDATKISALHLAVLISCYRYFGFAHHAWLLVPMAFVVVANVSFFGMILNDQLRRVTGARRGAEVSRGAPSTLRSLLVLPTDYGLLCLIFLLLGSRQVFFVAYLLLLAGSAGYLALACVKWFREMGALDRL